MVGLFRRRAVRRAQALAEAEDEQQRERDAARLRMMASGYLYDWRGPDRPAYIESVRRLAAPDARGRQ